MSIKLLAGVAGAALFSTVASAQFTASAVSPFDIADTATAAPRGDATGDLVETGLAIFGNLGAAAFYDTPIFHSIGSTETFPTATNVEVSSSIVDNGDGTRTMNISWLTNDGTALFGPNAFGAEFVTDLQFNLGAANTPNDFVEDPDYAGMADPSDGMGNFLSAFTLLDAAGGTIFAGNFFVQDMGTGFGGSVAIGAGGADLGTFNIGGGTASITYNVIPAPGAAALFGLGGLAAARRRR